MKKLQVLVLLVGLCACGTTHYRIVGDREGEVIRGEFTGSAESAAKLAEEMRKRIEADNQRRAIEVAREVNLKSLDVGLPAMFSVSPGSVNAGQGGMLGGGMMMSGSPFIAAAQMAYAAPIELGATGGQQQPAAQGNVTTGGHATCPRDRDTDRQTLEERVACMEPTLTTVLKAQRQGHR